MTTITGDHESTADDAVTPVTVASDRPGPPFRTSGWLNDSDDGAAYGPGGDLTVSPDSKTLYVTVVAGLEIFHA